MADYDIGSAFETIENELIDSMMRNFARHRAEEAQEVFLWSQWQAEQLRSLELYRKRNAKKFNQRFSEINGKVAEMLHRARADGNAEQEADILKAIRNGFQPPIKPPKSSTGAFFKLNEGKLNALIKATTDDLVKAEHAILRMSNDKYRKAIFNAQVYANTGAATYEKAVDMACRDMLRAGLNCVEYKNGARHTLEDYARMAIRTSSKRAYHYGEGEKRREWGISTVVVNNRHGGCPLCAQYIGKVFIDDVYSGGKKGDGNYPLLSEAIEGGLFHPNCKDGTSTYYEGITTLKPVSKEELRQMAKREKLEAQEKYYENQAEKNHRIADHSLDGDNKKIYSHRAEQSEKKAAQAAKKLEGTVDISGKSSIIKAAGNNRERNVKLEKTIHRCIAAVRPIFAEGILGKNALSIKPIPHTYDVVAHGTSDFALVFDTQITPNIMANIIKARTDYTDGLPIRLISCNTGSANSKGDCFAQKLSDILRVKVSAPNQLVWVYPNGDLIIGTSARKSNGKMIDFFPRGDNV